MPSLFDPFSLKGVTLRNRIAVSPMCQYSADDGVPTDWHPPHLIGLARGGAGLVVGEATAVSPEGRITPGCTGIWNETQAEAWAPIAAGIAKAGAVPGIQIGHAGARPRRLFRGRAAPTCRRATRAAGTFSRRRRSPSAAISPRSPTP